mmetsp:Transcript_85164/g.237707  ORF Transcript_85164/g.237707 Transcript_85164/m.237707 type:complete len:119 (-) Transcript_85164:190-546(-)
MVGGGGGLRGGAGGNHRPLTGCAGGRRTTNFPTGTRGHPGDGHCPNPPTYQTSRQLGHDLVPMKATLYGPTRSMYDRSGLGKTASVPSLTRQGPATPTTFHELQAQRLFKSMPQISPW